LKIVSAYTPIPINESVSPGDFHKELALAGFDWLDALQMLRSSAQRRAGVETFAITNAELPFPHYRYATAEKKLMLWVLEVSLMYLASDDFDQNTVFIAPDSLVLKPLDVFGDFDIAVTWRGPKFPWDGEFPASALMNGLQWWAVAGKKRLVALYEQALDIARALPEAEQDWGADTIPLVRLLGPFEPGLFDRGGLALRVLPFGSLLTIVEHRRGKKEPASALVVDFKYRNKMHMREYYGAHFT